MEEKISYMKKVLFVLTIALLGWVNQSAALSGVISGTVTNAPTGGVYVHITMYEDTFPSAGVALFSDSVLTDFTGSFSLPYTITTTSVRGAVTAWVATCSLSVDTDTTNWDSATVKNPTISLHYCGVPPPCNADFSSTFSGSNVQFTNVSVPNSGRLSYSWDFGDSSTSTNKNPVHSYLAQGSYYVCLTIYDTATFCASTFCDSVIVDSNAVCQAEFSYLANGLQLQFSNHFPKSQNQWSFGDGATSFDVNPSHTYLNRGSYNVCLLVLDTNCIDTLCQTIVVSDLELSGTLTAVGSGVQAQSLELIRQQASGLLEVTDVKTVGGAFGNSYSFPVLPGTYHVRTNPVLTASHLPTYLGNELSWVNSTAVIISSASSFGNDIALFERQMVSGPGSIQGKVVDESNNPVVGARMLLKNNSGEGVTTALTTNDGLYELNNLPYGTYFLFVDRLNKLPYERMVVLSPDEPTRFGVDFDLIDRPVVGIEQVNGPAENWLYPNPSKGIVYISVNDEVNKLEQLIMTDMLGKRIVFDAAVVERTEQFIMLDLSALQKGVYLLTQVTEQGTYTERLIIQ
jgi:PKD repeat protein